MTAKVIQGFFVGDRPRLPSPVAQPKAMPRLPGPPVPAFAGRPPGPPAPAFAGRPPVAQSRLPGPPAPAFAGRPPVAQLHGAGAAFSVDPGRLGLASSGGRPLPEAVRGKMEAALGADFSNVRVYVGPQAERIGAIAFTLGSDIYFAPGRFQPETAHGQQLLGHELAHVVQQRAGRVRNPLGSGIAVVQDHALEAEADRLGQHAAAHRVVAQPKMTAGAVQPSSPVWISPAITQTGVNRRGYPQLLEAAISRQNGQQLAAHGLTHMMQQDSRLASGFIQRLRAPRRVAQATIQRYFLGAATATTSNTALLGQDRHVADNSFRDPNDPTHTAIRTSGTDPTLANSLKISEDGKMAIENVNGNRQAKVFFAKLSVVKKSNDVLTRLGSSILLQPAGGTIDVDDQNGTTHQLYAIEPVANPDAGMPSTRKAVAGRLVGFQHGLNVDVDATCVAVAEAIMHKKYSSYGGGATWGTAYMSADKLAKLGLIGTAQKDQWAAAVADAFAKEQTRRPHTAVIDQAAIARSYGIFLNLNPDAAARMAKKLGVNEFANPKVGQSFISESVGVDAGGYIVNWLPDRNFTGTIHTANMTPDPNVRGGQRRTGWGNHMGAVVARSAGNTVTLENYARSGEDVSQISNDRIFYFAMYGPRSQPTQTWHHVWSRGNAPIANAVTGVVG